MCVSFDIHGTTYFTKSLSFGLRDGLTKATTWKKCTKKTTCHKSYIKYATTMRKRKSIKAIGLWVLPPQYAKIQLRIMLWEKERRECEKKIERDFTLRASDR